MANQGQTGRSQPRTRADQKIEYDRREAAFWGDAYDKAEVRVYGAFQAMDENNNVIIPAQRISSDVPYVVNTEAAAIATDGVLVSVRQDAPIPTYVLDLVRADPDLGADAELGDEDGDLLDEAERAIGSGDAEDESAADVVEATLAAIEERDEQRARVFLRQLAEDIWRRSRLHDRMDKYARQLCMLGKVGLWAVLRETPGGDRAYIVQHDPRDYTSRLDPLGVDIESVTLTLRYLEHDDGDPEAGVEGSEMQVHYRALLNPTSIDVWLRRDTEAGPGTPERDQQQSGTNTLGVVPWVDAIYAEGGRYGMPLWSGHGLETASAAVDSMLTQGLALGRRHANPLLAMFGARFAADVTADDPGDSDLAQPGAVIDGLPAEARLEWLEANLQGTQVLANMAASIREQMRQANPAFLFQDGGANSSGRALSYRASAFRAKMQPVAERAWRALELATAYAVALQLGQPWGEGLWDLFEVAGGEAVPGDISAIIEDTLKLLDAEVLSVADAVRQLQAVGVLPDDVDAETYLERIAEETAPRRMEARETIAMMAGQMSPGVSEEAGAAPEEPEA